MVKTIGIVSLSSGILGENFVSHEAELGIKRLEAYGIAVRFLPHALRSPEYVQAHPEKRAEDLLAAFQDPEIDMILCAIGGDDTYRLLPYLFDQNALQKAISNKIFLGFSDTTINHLMLHKAGLNTFYGQSFLTDICELSQDMLPYTKRCFEELISPGRIGKITPSDTWYKNRTSFDPDQLGVPLKAFPNHGFELLQGVSCFSGKILGGCIDSLFDLFDGARYADMPILNKRYGLFPSLEDWKDKILLLESSEEKMSPEKYEKALRYLKNTGIFNVISGILIGKPMDEIFAAEYKEKLIKVIDDPRLPIVCNLNVGHALPRCIIPFGVNAAVNTELQQIVFDYQ